MAENAHARAADPGAAVGLDEQIAAQDNATPINGQAVVLPSLTEARAHLVEVIRQKPERKPAVTIIDVRRWERDGRAADAARMLKRIPPHPTHIATVLGVSTRCVQYWLRGERTPTVRNWQRLRSLHALCRRDLWGAWS